VVSGALRADSACVVYPFQDAGYDLLQLKLYWSVVEISKGATPIVIFKIEFTPKSNFGGKID